MPLPATHPCARVRVRVRAAVARSRGETPPRWPAGATVAGYGFLVEKSYEEGRKNLRQGVPVAALTVISSIASGKIEFGEPEPSCPDSPTKK